MGERNVGQGVSGELVDAECHRDGGGVLVGERERSLDGGCPGLEVFDLEEVFGLGRSRRDGSAEEGVHLHGGPEGRAAGARRRVGEKHHGEDRQAEDGPDDVGGEFLGG